MILAFSGSGGFWWFCDLAFALKFGVGVRQNFVAFWRFWVDFLIWVDFVVC